MRAPPARLASHARAACFFIALTPLLVGVACRSKSCGDTGRSSEVMPIASAERSMRALGAAPSRCLAGPWSLSEQASWRARPRERGPNSLRPVAALVDLDDRSLIAEIADRVIDKTVYRGVIALDHAELTIHLVYWLRAEVDNGGFQQFFFNSAGDCALQTADAIRELGIPELETVYARVLASFPNARPSEDRSTRWRELDRVPDSGHAWSAENEAFWNLPVWEALQRYVRAHLAELELPPAP